MASVVGRDDADAQRHAHHPPLYGRCGVQRPPLGSPHPHPSGQLQWPAAALQGLPQPDRFPGFARAGGGSRQLRVRHRGGGLPPHRAFADLDASRLPLPAQDRPRRPGRGARSRLVAAVGSACLPGQHGSGHPWQQRAIRHPRPRPSPLRPPPGGQQRDAARASARARGVPAGHRAVRRQRRHLRGRSPRRGGHHRLGDRVRRQLSLPRPRHLRVGAQNPQARVRDAGALDRGPVCVRCAPAARRRRTVDQPRRRASRAPRPHPVGRRPPDRPRPGPDPSRRRPSPRRGQRDDARDRHRPPHPRRVHVAAAAARRRHLSPTAVATSPERVA